MRSNLYFYTTYQALMNYQIIIPAHNEEKHIDFTLHSLANQTVLPKKILIVNDNSTDNTQLIIDKYCQQYPELFSSVRLQSEAKHLPGSKVINAFNYGYKTLDKETIQYIFALTYFSTCTK